MNGDPIIHDGMPAGLQDLGEWYISEFTNDDTQLTVRGRFRLSPLNRLNPEQTKFLLTFLRCRGVISSVEKELGISYPTVRSRLDSLLAALGLSTGEATGNGKREVSQRQKEILEQLEAGEISPDEAKKMMKEAGR